MACEGNFNQNSIKTWTRVRDGSTLFLTVEVADGAITAVRVLIGGDSGGNFDGSQKADSFEHQSQGKKKRDRHHQADAGQQKDLQCGFFQRELSWGQGLSQLRA